MTVTSATARDFPNPGLGCPEPGLVYPQVITPGYQVLLEADGERFDYRVDEGGQIVRRCPIEP